MTSKPTESNSDRPESKLTVTTLRKTPRPEELVAVCARGDYYDGFVGEDDYDEVMDGISFDDKHEEWAREFLGNTETGFTYGVEHYARMYSFLERLFRRGHWGPFEHPQITFGVKGASRSCMAQITRHRHVSFDVQSQRYVDFSEKDDPVQFPRSLEDPDHFSRETGAVDLHELDREFHAEFYQERAQSLFDDYEQMVADGVPKEDARFILPIGTRVNWTMSMNARALLHLADMRAKSDAQWEARMLADKVLDAFQEWCPITYALWEEHGPHKLAP